MWVEDSALVWRVAGTFTKKSKPMRDSMASMVVTVGASLEEFVSNRENCNFRKGWIIIENTEPWTESYASVQGSVLETYRTVSL